MIRTLARMAGVSIACRSRRSCAVGVGERSAFQRWIKAHRPDVILTLHPRIREWLEMMNLKSPDDIGLVHLDLTDGLEGWAGMRQNNEQIGIAAVDMLAGQLHRNEIGPPPFQKCMFIEGKWVEGETIRRQDGESRPAPRKTARSKK